MIKAEINSKEKVGIIELTGTLEDLLEDFSYLTFTMMKAFRKNDISFDVVEDLMNSAFESGKEGINGADIEEVRA